VPVCLHMTGWRQLTAMTSQCIVVPMVAASPAILSTTRSTTAETIPTRVGDSHQFFKLIFRPGSGSPSTSNVVVVVVFFLVLLSDFRSAKAFSFHNRSSPNFAYT